MKTSGGYNPIGQGIVGVNDQTGTSYTLALTDAGKLVRCTNAFDIYLTVPKDTFPANAVITLEQGGAGALVLIAGTDVTINAYDTGLMAQGQYAGLQLVHRGSNVWTCFGGVSIDVTTTTTTAAATTTTTTSA